MGGSVSDFPQTAILTFPGEWVGGWPVGGTVGVCVGGGIGTKASPSALENVAVNRGHYVLPAAPKVRYSSYIEITIRL